MCNVRRSHDDTLSGSARTTPSPRRSRGHPWRHLRERIIESRCRIGASGIDRARCLPPYAGVGDWVCIAFAAIISPLLVGLSVALFGQASREIHAGSFSGIVELLRLSVLLLTASLCGGIAATSRARNVAALMTIAISAPAIVCAFRYHGSGLQMGFLFLFAIPTVYGAWVGYRKRHSQRIWLIPMLLLTLIATLIVAPPILSHGYTMLNASLLAAPAMYCWSIKSFGARHAHS